jgi:fibronectin type 3 domain-containing protein
MFKLIHLRAAVLVIAVGCGVASWAIGQAASPAAVDHPAAAVHHHSVKLSWAASVPASKSPGDAVVGYNVYRSTTSHDPKPKRINSKLCAGTTYTDTEVEAGKTYFYVTRGVNAKGVESGSSNEIKVVMPSR